MKIFVDTSVFGGVFDEAWSKSSIDFFVRSKEKRFQVVVSRLVKEEVFVAPPKIISYFIGVAPLEVSAPDEADRLAKLYIDSGALREKDYGDAMHIACATLHKCAAIVSWNFKHIVNTSRVVKYNNVNLRENHNKIKVYAPDDFVNIFFNNNYEEKG